MAFHAEKIGEHGAEGFTRVQVLTEEVRRDEQIKILVAHGERALHMVLQARKVVQLHIQEYASHRAPANRHDALRLAPTIIFAQAVVFRESHHHDRLQIALDFMERLMRSSPGSAKE